MQEESQIGKQFGNIPLRGLVDHRCNWALDLRIRVRQADLEAMICIAWFGAS
ncbi:MAG TPA: hypothetical protein VFU22_06025 [Roseiflexaceae bacterium]|nr:hypothetical protein [Roseiflexaceae bacterium]